jgi:hypothetical protein
MACRCHSHHVRPDDAPLTPRDLYTATVAVVRGGRSASVWVAGLPARHGRGGLSVRLDRLWFASGLSGDLHELVFDFVGEGGYRASRNGFPPLSGRILAQGYLVLETGRVEWEESAQVACVYRVKGLTMLVAHASAEEAASTISV